MKHYSPLEHSIVQAITQDSMQRYEATDFHEALLFAIAREMGRVSFNVYQRQWDRWGDDPQIPGVHWRRFSYECGCPVHRGEFGGDFYPAGHLPECAHQTPHFEFDGVAFDWYKSPGRGMSVSHDMSPAEWVAWFDRCLDKIRAFEDSPKANEIRAERVRAKRFRRSV